MLVLCAELAVKEADFHPFEGRISRRIKEVQRQQSLGNVQEEADAEDDDSDATDEAELSIGNLCQWRVPSTLLCPLSSREQRNSSLQVGLKNLAFELEQETHPGIVDRPNEQDKRSKKLPIYIQLYSQVVDMGTRHPISYLKSFLKLCTLCYDHQMLDDIVRRRRQGNWYCHRRRTIFCRPDFNRLSKCSPNTLSLLMQQWAKVIVNAYDLEWFNLIRTAVQKHYHHYNCNYKHRGQQIQPKVGNLSHFPTTVNEVRSWAHRVATESPGVSIGFNEKFNRAKGKKILVQSEDELYSLIAGPFGNESKSGQWNNSLTRSLVHQAEHFTKQIAMHFKDRKASDTGEDSSDEEEQTVDTISKADLLTDKGFRSILCKEFASHWRRREPLDTSAAIIWHTTATTQFRPPSRANHGDSPTFMLYPRILQIKPPIKPSRKMSKSMARAMRSHEMINEHTQFPHAGHMFDEASKSSITKFQKELLQRGIMNLHCVLVKRVIAYCANRTGIFPSKIKPLQGTLSLHDLSLNKTAFDHVCNRAFQQMKVDGQTQDMTYDSWHKHWKEQLNSAKNGIVSSKMKTMCAGFRNARCWKITPAHRDPDFPSLLVNEGEDERKCKKWLRKGNGKTTLAVTACAVNGITSAALIDQIKAEFHDFLDATWRLQKNNVESPEANPRKKSRRSP